MRGSGAADPLQILLDLLVRHPDAMVAAIGDDGIIVPMPRCVPLIDHRVVVSRSVIDMVIPSDHVEVITTWERSRREGGAAMLVHLLTKPDQAVLVTFAAGLDRFGVHLALVVPAEDTGERVDQGASPPFVAPRTARIRKNELAVITEIDDATTQILGWRPHDMIGRRSLEFIHPDDQERSIANWMEMLTAPGHAQRVRLRHLTADGAWTWMEFTNRKLLGTDAPCVHAEMLDVSEEHAAHEALRASEHRLRRLAAALPLGVLQIERDRRIAYSNERLGEIIGMTEGESIEERFRHLDDSDRDHVDVALDAVLEHGLDRNLAVRFRSIGPRRGLGPIHCSMTLRALTTDAGGVTGAIVCVADVSEQVRMTNELEQRATFDALTGCFNRPSVMARLDAMLTQAGGVAIVFVDLDGFKDVNDEFGHAAGDALLLGVAERLRAAVRDGDIVGRVGGDEFLVVCRDIADAEEAFAIATRIESSLERGIPVQGRTLVVRASLGIAQTDDVTMSSDRLVAEADARMYVEKRGRTRRPELGPSDRPASLRTRWSEESVALRRALESDQLAVHYQPIVHLPSHELYGLEALARWNRDGEVLPAASFIAVAERSGLITEVGARVADAVVRAAAGPAAAGTHWFVNMSAQELAVDSRVDELVAALERHGVDPELIVVEVTQHTDLMRSPAAIAALRRLAAIGVAVALDGFGTGHSSFELLRAVPVSYLEFGGSFTAGLGSDAVADHLLSACLDLSGRLGVQLIVEGVETPAQRDHLVAAGVELAQGRLFCAPSPLDELHIARFV